LLIHWASRDNAMEYSASAPILSMSDGQVSERRGRALLVRDGFAVPAWLPPVYRFDTERIGKVIVSTQPVQRPGSQGPSPIELQGIDSMSGEYDERGVILALNNGEYEKGFALCMVCGYAASETEADVGKRNEALPESFTEHAPMWAQSMKDVCKWETPLPRRNLGLAAKQETNVLRIRPSTGLGLGSRRVASAVATALAMAGARLMQLDAREIGAVSAYGKFGFEAVLWDNNPGGSGLLEDLCDDARSWFNKAADLLYVNEEHHQRCETGCILCLLAFSTQGDVALRRFDRPEAFKVLRQ